MKRFASLLCALCFAVLGCSCSGNSAPSTPAAPSGTPASAAPEPVTYFMDSGSDTAEGYYDLLSRSDKGANIIYYDYATKVCVYLSSDVNSTHNSADDTSYLPNTLGGIDLFTDGSKLYAIKSGRANYDSPDPDDAASILYQMDLDGQNRREIRLPANTVFSGGHVFSSNGKLICLCKQIEEDWSGVWQLREMDFASGTSPVLSELPNCDNAVIAGAWQDRILLCMRNRKTQQFRILLLNPESGEQTEILSDLFLMIDSLRGRLFFAGDGEVQLYDFSSGKSESTGVLLAPLEDGFFEFPGALNETDGLFYYAKGGEIWSFDPDTKTACFTDFSVPVKEGERCYVRVDHGYLEIWFEDGHVYFDPASKKEFPGYPDVEDKPVFIQGEFGDSYFVKMGSIHIQYQDFNPDGVPIQNEMGLPHYVLIKKEDFWNGRPIFEEFDNQVFKTADFDVKLQ